MGKIQIFSGPESGLPEESKGQYYQHRELAFLRCLCLMLSAKTSRSTQPAPLITDVVIMEAEWTKTHFPNSKPQAHFPSSATNWNAGSEQMLSCCCCSLVDIASIPGWKRRLWGLRWEVREMAGLCRQSPSLLIRTALGVVPQRSFCLYKVSLR